MRYVVCGLLALSMSVNPSAQAPPAEPRFEVASVKPVNERGASGGFPSFFVTTGPVLSLIGFAYNTPLPQIDSGDAWTRNDLFEVRATLPESVRDPSLGTMAQMTMVADMMKHLLRERFALRIRIEDGTRSVLFLRVKNPKRANAPGRLAPDADCVQRAEALQAKLEADAKGGPTPFIAPGGLIEPPCGIGIQVKGDSLFLISKGTTVAALAMRISAHLRQPVEDQTGMRGYFGLNLEMGADQNPTLARAGSVTPGPTIETALGDDLNLELVRGTMPARRIVVEHVERPTPN